MRMLKRTSKHHQPAHLAAAVALGILVGLVPKANLLAVGLYAALLWLPIHTWLALAVSMVIAIAASYLDPLTHGLGSWLLRQQMLRPLWYCLDNTAVLPWLGLHNTIVLGSLVSGVALAAPSYLISLRLFEQMRWKTNKDPAEQPEQSVDLVPRPLETAMVPPPKFAPLPQSAAMPLANEACDPLALEDDDFEPVREVAAIINSWHIAHVAKQGLQARALSATSTPVAHASSGQTPSTGGFIKSNDRADEFRPRSFVPPPRPWAGERSDVVDSLDLAHNASEVLDWVDGMLEDCLSEDSINVVTHAAQKQNTTPVAITQAVEAEPLQPVDGQEEQWLMETTIEVVRWGDGAPPAIPPAVAPTTSAAAHADAGSIAQSTVAETSTSGTLPTVPAMPPRISEAGELHRSAAQPSQPAAVPWLPSGSQNKRLVQSEGQPHDADSDEPPRGECLGFLLGHLRQEREGRSS